MHCWVESELVPCAPQVMQLVESLCKLASERSSLIADAPAPGHAELLDAMDQRSVALTTAISEADVKIADTQVQRRDGEEARGPALCLDLHGTHMPGMELSIGRLI